MEGSSGKILYHRGTVFKHSRHGDIRNEAEIHRKAYNISREFNYLRIPLIHNVKKNCYQMEKIDCSQPVFFSSISDLTLYQPVIKELSRFFLKMIHKYNIFPYDFELYKQSDGTVMMIDFDKFREIHNGTIQVGKFKLDVKHDAFIQPALPINFQNGLNDILNKQNARKE